MSQSENDDGKYDFNLDIRDRLIRGHFSVIDVDIPDKEQEEGNKRLINIYRNIPDNLIQIDGRWIPLHSKLASFKETFDDGQSTDVITFTKLFDSQNMSEQSLIAEYMFSLQLPTSKHEVKVDKSLSLKSRMVIGFNHLKQLQQKRSASL
jgi:hypothetical protein